MAPECTWCSCHSPGTVSGNFIARKVPELVPAKSIRPERDITHCVKTMSLAGTSRRICYRRTKPCICQFWFPFELMKTKWTEIFRIQTDMLWLRWVTHPVHKILLQTWGQKRFHENLVLSNEMIKGAVLPWKIWRADVSSVSPSSRGIKELSQCVVFRFYEGVEELCHWWKYGDVNLWVN